MVHKLLNIYTQSFKSQSLGNTYFYGLRGRQSQGPPRAAHTLATPLPLMRSLICGEFDLARNSDAIEYHVFHFEA